MRNTTSVGYVVIAIYVDNILWTRNNEAGISTTKAHLQTHFAIHDLKTPRYFLGIEFSYQSGKLALSQRKYPLDFLQEIGLLGCKARPKFWDTVSPMMADANRYRHLLGKLIYLIVTHPDIIYFVSVLSQFMQEPRMMHWGCITSYYVYQACSGKGLIYQHHDHLCIEAYSDAGYTKDKGEQKSTTGFCTYVGGNLVTWHSRKQIVISCLNAEVEYQAMAAVVCEMV